MVQNGQWLFCHGLLAPHVLAELLEADAEDRAAGYVGMTFQNLRGRIGPAKLAGYRRVFAGEFGLCSVVASPQHEIFGLAVELTA